MKDPVERGPNLEEAAAALRRGRDALKDLSDAAAVIKRSREAVKDLANSLRREIEGLQQGERASVVEPHRVRWTIPVTQPMVLCSQVQRSGGTLLVRLFDGHPSCFVHPSELRWARLQKRVWPQLDLTAALDADDLLAQLDEGWPERFAADGYEKYSTWTHREHPGDVRRYPFIFDAALQRWIFAETLSRHATPTQRDVLNAYLTSLFNAWLDYQNLYRMPKEWVVAFSPRLVTKSDGIDRFFVDYPDGLLVTIVRDPREWLASYSRHVGEVPSATLLDDEWIRSVEASLRAHAAHPDRVIVLLFADLVHQTEAVVRHLCERMRIPFSDVLLEPTYNSMPVLSDSSHTMATGIDPNVTDWHRDALSAEQLQLVERTALPRYQEIRARFALAQTT